MIYCLLSLQLETNCDIDQSENVEFHNDSDNDYNLKHCETSGLQELVNLPASSSSFFTNKKIENRLGKKYMLKDNHLNILKVAFIAVVYSPTLDSYEFEWF